MAIRVGISPQRFIHFLVGDNVCLLFRIDWLLAVDAKIQFGHGPLPSSGTVSGAFGFRLRLGITKLRRYRSVDAGLHPNNFVPIQLRLQSGHACSLTEAIRSLVREVKLLFIAVASVFSFRTTSPFF